MTPYETPTEVQDGRDVVRTGTGPGDAPQCAACAHAVEVHDAIELRYCNATRAHALRRGCICRSR